MTTTTELAAAAEDLFTALGFPAVTAGLPAAEPSSAVTAAVAVGDGLDEVRSVLAESSISGTRLDLPATTLPRVVWETVHATLTGMGAKGGSRRGQPYRFDTDRTADLAAFIVGGPAPRSERTTAGWVPTPGPLAVDVVTRFADLGSLRDGARVLEPSAGQGALVRAVVDHAPGAVQVDAVEAAVERSSKLAGYVPGCWVHAEPFEDFAGRLRRLKSAPYDLVVMNPPYSVPGNKTIWIDHVRMAWQLLAPGGRLVAILPGRVWQRGDRKTRALLAELGPGAEFEELPGGSFHQSGTDVDTCVLAVSKPTAAGPVLKRADRSLYRPAQGEPVRVAEPSLTVYDTTERPVQLYRGFGGDIVIRYAGLCIACSGLTWTDGDNDPRGAMGLRTVHVLRADEHGMQGPDVCLCAGCAQGSIMWNRGFDKAKELWTEPVVDPELPEPEDLLEMLAAYAAGLPAVEHVVAVRQLPDRNCSQTWFGWGCSCGDMSQEGNRWSDEAMALERGAHHTDTKNKVGVA